MRVFGWILVAALLTGLMACGSKKQKPEPRPPANVTTGSTFEVLKAFDVQPGQGGVYFQDAGIVAESRLGNQYPYCLFSPEGASGSRVTVQPQVFEVNSVSYGESSAGTKGELSAASHLRLSSRSGGRGATMSCMFPGRAMQAGFVTPDEIQGALGGYFAVEVAP